MDEKLTQLRHMVVTAILLNYKINEDPIMRSTLDELLKPLIAKELKGFMLLLAQTSRNFRSVLEIVSDVVDQLIKKRFKPTFVKEVADAMQMKFHALIQFASKQIKASAYANESEYLKELDFTQFKEKDQPLFNALELFVIESIGFDILLKLYDDDLFLFEKRISDAVHAYQMQDFSIKNQLQKPDAQSINHNA